MSDKISLTAELRQDVGKGASRRLRRNGKSIPAIIYGADQDPQNLTLAANEVTKAMQIEAFFSQIMDVVVDGGAQPAVVRDLQRNPANGRVLHIDFQRVSADREITVNLPLHFINEENCVGVKIGGGNIAHNLTEVEVSALPANLPEFIEVDMIEIEAGSSVHLSDLVMPEGVTVVALTYGEDRDIPVASVTVRRGGAQDLEDEELEGSAEGAGEDADAGSEDTGEAED
ncbi:MAG: 50S ribosomal protein L25/general stress protein Ctc [Pseudomonadota bacterium]